MALFDPFTLRGLALANRIVVSPMCQYSAVDGRATDWHLVHWGQLLQSGAAMLVVEATAVTPEGRITPTCLGLYDDGCERALADTLARARGVAPPMPVAMQLAHAGRKASSAAPWVGGRTATDAGGWTPVAPSAVPYAEGDVVPAALDAAGLARVRDAFVAAARRAQRAGIDALEVHMAHGYLLHEFLSPLSNARTDAYGGDLERRMRFPLEVFDAVRDAFPDDRPVGVRVSATDWVDGGWALPDTIALAQAAEDARLRLDRRVERGHLAGAEDRIGAGAARAVRPRDPRRDRRPDDRRRPDHRTRAGRRHRRLGRRRPGRAGPRHAVEPAMAVARRGGAGRDRRAAAALRPGGPARGGQGLPQGLTSGPPGTLLQAFKYLGKFGYQ